MRTRNQCFGLTLDRNKMIIKGADEERKTEMGRKKKKKKSIPFLFVSPAPLNDQHVLKPNASTMRQGGDGGGQKLVYLGPSESQPSGVNKSILITGHSNHSGMTRSPSKCF